MAMAEECESLSEAPPKQVAMAMERLGQASRIIAEIRMTADRFLEALISKEEHPDFYQKSLNLIIKEDSFMRQHLQELRSVGEQLEESGVLNESLRSRCNSWALHMPLVCPDGSVVAYAWKRQLAGQAAGSAVERARLAMKAFTDKKRLFFPHLLDDKDSSISDMEPHSKRLCGPQMFLRNCKVSDCYSLSDLLVHFEKAEPAVKVSTYGRIEWLKRASLLPSSHECLIGSTARDIFHVPSNIRSVSMDPVIENNIAVIELFFPSVFRALISLHSAGSNDPDSVAFFSADEGGSHVHTQGSSTFHVFKHISEHGSMALQYFISLHSKTALHAIFHWICSYQDLFSKSCSKCGRLLSMDRQSGILLPPTYRPYHRIDVSQAYHPGCLTVFS